jgi:hypothetical protein
MLPPKQVFVICDYIFALRIEMRLSDNYRVSILNTLLTLSSTAAGKGFRDFTRADNIRYLERFRKDDSEDPTHKSFGTYNTNLVNVIKFLRWLYYPDLEPAKRPKPTVAQNLPKLKRLGQEEILSAYNPSDMWSGEDNLLFLNSPRERIVQETDATMQWRRT